MFTCLKAKKIPEVPAQRKGAFHDTESLKRFEDSDVASKVYELVKNKFFNINDWATYCDHTFADFKLFNCNGNPVFRTPEKGDLIRIHIGACPGNSDFWVTIQDIVYDYAVDVQRSLIVFRPTYDPYIKQKYIEHFYSRHSTSTFMVIRENRQITVAVYGRNETPNFDTGFINKIKNTFTALLAIVGFSKIQWKIFTDAIIKVEMDDLPKVH